MSDDDLFVTDARLKNFIAGRGWIAGKPQSGGGGVTTYAALTDASTVSLPTVNTPLSTALSTLSTSIAGKQNTLTAGNNITLNGNTISAAAGASTFIQLTDHESVDLPNVNTPLNNALSAKQGTLVNGTNINGIGEDNVISVVDEPTFSTVHSSGIAFANSSGPALDYYDMQILNLSFAATGSSQTYVFEACRIGSMVTISLTESITFTANSVNAVSTEIPLSFATSYKYYFSCLLDGGTTFSPITASLQSTILSLGLEPFVVGTEYTILPFSFTYVI